MKKLFPYLEFHTEIFNLQVLQYVEKYVVLCVILLHRYCKYSTVKSNLYRDTILSITTIQYTVIYTIYSNLPYCQFQWDPINWLCVYNLQDRNSLFYFGSGHLIYTNLLLFIWILSTSLFSTCRLCRDRQKLDNGIRCPTLTTYS